MDKEKFILMMIIRSTSFIHFFIVFKRLLSLLFCTSLIAGCFIVTFKLKQGLNEFGTFLIVPSLVHFSITIIIFAINWPYCAFYSLYTLR